MEERVSAQLSLLLSRYPALAPLRGEIAAAYELLKDCFEAGGKVLIGGNGGSCADAEHIVGELMKGFKLPRRLPDAEQTALREVAEEAGVRPVIMGYIGTSQYSFFVPEGEVHKEVHWFLMMADSYHSKPQKEEYFLDSGYYKYHEAYHLLKFSNERMILEKGYRMYQKLKQGGLWVPAEGQG